MKKSFLVVLLFAVATIANAVDLLNLFVKLWKGGNKILQRIITKISYGESEIFIFKLLPCGIQK